jgi:hypothetical protein
LSTFFKNQFPEFIKIVENKLQFDNKDKDNRFEYGIFSNFRDMNECIKMKFIDFNGNKLYITEGFII